MTSKVTDELRKSAFALLHAGGWTDTPIGHVLHAERRTVKAWRTELGLPTNPHPGTKIRDSEARAMYDAGHNDREIALHFGVHFTAVMQWRDRRGLKTKFEWPHAMTDEMRRRAKKMLRLGATTTQVGAALNDGRSKRSVVRLRSTMTDPGLRPRGINNVSIRKRVIRDPGVVKRIEAAIGRGAPSDVRAEATSELYLAVLDGLVSVDLIEQVAPTYRNRAYELCGSKFGARSLDEEHGEDGWTMLDALEDESALEAMEAAAEAAWNDN